MERIVRVGSILADPTRAEILATLMDGRAYTGSELARHVGVAASTASEHLSKLINEGMVTVEPQGRHRYFRMNRSTAEMLESIGLATETATEIDVKAPASLVHARSCYDHLAGEVAVEMFDFMVEQGFIEPVEHTILKVTDSGHEFLEDLGLDMSTLADGSRPLARSCLDWTQRRHHLGGGAGAALLDTMLSKRWVVKGSRPRSITVTNLGKKQISSYFS